jgi:hypothetical protein
VGHAFGVPRVRLEHRSAGLFSCPTQNDPSAYPGGEILGFRAGDRADETDLHYDLREHVHHGREWYHPTPEVFAVVNAMRDDFGLPHLAA